MTAGAGIDQYNAQKLALLTRGNYPNQALNAGAALSFDVPCGGADLLTVEASLTGSANADLTIAVQPYAGDGTTVYGNQSLPPIANFGFAPNFAAGKVQAVQQWNVQGIDKVLVTIKNNNAGAQTLNANWRVEYI